MAKRYSLVSFFIILIFFPGFTFAQINEKKLTSAEYIEKYQSMALWEMNEFKIPASIILAQGILETNSGNSVFFKKSGNHFGIKCHKDWEGDTVLIDDDAQNECFRKYKNDIEAFRDHGLFLTTRNRYASLFSLDITDYRAWAEGLKRLGYATNPKYAEALIRIIESNKLYDIDKTSKEIILAKESAIANTSDCSRFLKGYIHPTRDRFQEKKKIKNRTVYVNNKIAFIFIEEGDNFFKLASELNTSLYQICWYNDMKKTDCLSEGQILYIAKKKRKSGAEKHEVQAYENLYSISQLYGVRLKNLIKYNKLPKNYEVKKGDMVWLHKNKNR